MELQDLRFDDIETYFDEVSKEASKFEDGMSACREVVSIDANCIRLIKGIWNPHYLVINFWPSEKACMQFNSKLISLVCCM